MPSCVRYDVITAMGTGRPYFASSLRPSSSLMSRKVRSPETGTSPFTAPPKRVPAPPATMRAATWPLRKASSPRAR